jgi:hypothetical protein
MSYRTYSVDEIIAYARKYSKYYQELYKDIPEDASYAKSRMVQAC